ncbi:hypothetical protein HMPREF9120_01283 [Neisseria sp. oral taxon 020 str. F0370]|nr:hypothetical protein HMPREF9120_01283 [Neisseria sp. oral taxon 020 str. F0370]
MPAANQLGKPSNGKTRRYTDDSENGQARPVCNRFFPPRDARGFPTLKAV